VALLEEIQIEIEAGLDLEESKRVGQFTRRRRLTSLGRSDRSRSATPPAGF
jgi:hypothetical protein